MEPLHLFVSVPVACFRVAQAREYWETYPVSPPATVYGMLLSLVGETDRLVHKGAEIAIALVSKPALSVVLRTLWRVKEMNLGPGLGRNARPDFQELLTNVKLSIWLRSGRQEIAAPSLFERVGKVISSPGQMRRFGGLSLGESTHLVDELRPWCENDPGSGSLLISDDRGYLSLPLWPDHVGSRRTVWGQFRLQKESPMAPQPADQGAWVRIGPPQSSAL